ncbi:hypothetical protein Emed_005205 [Eimeria media]
MTVICIIDLRPDSGALEETSAMTPTDGSNASSKDNTSTGGQTGCTSTCAQQEESASCERSTTPQIPSLKDSDSVELLENEHNVKKRGMTSLSSAAHREDTTQTATDDSTQSKRLKVEEASTGASDHTPALDGEKQTRELSSITSGQQVAEIVGQQLCSAQSKQLDGEDSMQEEGSCCLKGRQETVYENAWILAPMVRISTLPFRLESLKYGADLVYSEEIVDKKLLDSKRHINKDFNTIEYISRSEGRCVFSTCEEEKGKVVLQLGTADASLALQAANVVMQDIAAVDVNMGCPKSFSVKGGMGAALLSNPDVAMDILKTLRRNVSCPVTCKIRLLDTMEETVDFARKCESTGITAIAVHARKRHERPAHRANWQAFPLNVKAPDEVRRNAAAA